MVFFLMSNPTAKEPGLFEMEVTVGLQE